MKGLPGRFWTSFSESTRRAEVMIVATKRKTHLSRNHVRFVNLLHNPDEPVQAMALMRKLLAMDENSIPLEARAIDVGQVNWGSVVTVPQKDLSDGAWSYTSLGQSELVLVAEKIRLGESGPFAGVAVTELENLADLGPYHMQVKNPKQGLFNIVETDDNLRAGIPALWHQKSTRNTTLEAKANARLERRSDKGRLEQDLMLQREGRLQMACEVRMAPQRVAAVLTDIAMLGVRSWVTILPQEPVPGKEEALCLWLNSTPGLLLRIVHGNRPFLGRSELPHELARTLLVLDVDKLSSEQLRAAVTVYEDLKGRPLEGFGDIESDPVRSELNARLCREVLGVESAAVEEFTRKLALEPTMHARH